MKNIIRIFRKRKLLALIMKAGFRQKEGLSILTPDDACQQLIYMNRPAGHRTIPHMHKPLPRNIRFTQEILFVKSGRVKACFYDDKKRYLESRILNEGDFVFIAFGGHSFKFLEKTELIEIKQGPYLGEIQATKFQPLKTKAKP